MQLNGWKIKTKPNTLCPIRIIYRPINSCKVKNNNWIRTFQTNLKSWNNLRSLVFAFLILFWYEFVVVWEKRAQTSSLCDEIKKIFKTSVHGKKGNKSIPIEQIYKQISQKFLCFFHLYSVSLLWSFDSFWFEWRRVALLLWTEIECFRLISVRVNHIRCVCEWFCIRFVEQFKQKNHI